MSKMSNFFKVCYRRKKNIKRFSYFRHFRHLDKIIQILLDTLIFHIPSTDKQSILIKLSNCLKCLTFLKYVTEERKI